MRYGTGGSTAGRRRHPRPGAAPGTPGRRIRRTAFPCPPRPARTSHILAGADLVLATPTGFRTLPIHPAKATVRKPVGTTMPCAVIPQQYEKCGLAPGCCPGRPARMEAAAAEV